MAGCPGLLQAHEAAPMIVWVEVEAASHTLFAVNGAKPE
jgi:hypothetical protein